MGEDEMLNFAQNFLVWVGLLTLGFLMGVLCERYYQIYF